MWELQLFKEKLLEKYVIFEYYLQLEESLLLVLFPH
jgi:hypothetical protein